eukprot:162922-Rhodomonas_salina.1
MPHPRIMLRVVVYSTEISTRCGTEIAGGAGRRREEGGEGGEEGEEGRGGDRGRVSRYGQGGIILGDVRY